MSRPNDGETIPRLESLFSLTLSETERLRLERYVGLLRHWSRRLNLAGPALLDDPYPHLFEAVWVSRRGFCRVDRIVDVGSGCGIPGLILAAVQPESQVMLVERNQKKAVFLRQAARQLELQVEVFDRDLELLTDWQRHDLVTLRALKPSAGLLQALRQAGRPLLWLRGGSTAPELPGFRLLREERVPGSERRLASLLEADIADVSRET